MLQWVERESPHAFGGIVAELESRPSVGKLMHRQSHDQCDRQVDELYRVISQLGEHGGRLYHLAFSGQLGGIGT